MLTIILFISILAALGPQWIFIMFVSVALFKLYPLETLSLLVIAIALFIAGKRFRNRIKQYIKRIFK